MTTENTVGGYAFLPGSRFASNGVRALAGHVLERVVLAEPIVLDVGYPFVERYLERIQRPLAALCGLELRLPGPLAPEDFRSFNDRYLANLSEWGLLLDGVSPFCRTNVSPTTNTLAGSSLAAFSYTVEREGLVPTFMTSGIADIPDGGRFPDDIVRREDTSPEALLEKTTLIVETVKDQISSLATTWDQSVSVHLYSAHDLAFILSRQVLAKAGVFPANGIIWHDSLPPTSWLELEIDVRRYDREHLVVYS